MTIGYFRFRETIAQSTKIFERAYISVKLSEKKTSFAKQIVDWGELFLRNGTPVTRASRNVYTKFGFPS